MADAPKTNKYADELARAKTSELVNYLAHPQAIHQRIPPPVGNPLGFMAANDQVRAAWFEQCAEFVQAVADELDRRAPARLPPATGKS